MMCSQSNKQFSLQQRWAEVFLTQSSNLFVVSAKGWKQSLFSWPRFCLSRSRAERTQGQNWRSVKKSSLPHHSALTWARSIRPAAGRLQRAAMSINRKRCLHRFPTVAGNCSHVKFASQSGEQELVAFHMVKIRDLCSVRKKLSERYELTQEGCPEVFRCPMGSPVNANSMCSGFEKSRPVPTACWGANSLLITVIEPCYPLKRRGRGLCFSFEIVLLVPMSSFECRCFSPIWWGLSNQTPHLYRIPADVPDYGTTTLRSSSNNLTLYLPHIHHLYLPSIGKICTKISPNLMPQNYVIWLDDWGETERNQ